MVDGNIHLINHKAGQPTCVNKDHVIAHLTVKRNHVLNECKGKERDGDELKSNIEGRCSGVLAAPYAVPLFFHS